MIIFRNPGVLDIRAIKTFGLSSKEGQDKIGRFGTGLKYATSVIARHGGKMTIAAGPDVFTFGTAEDDFRGRSVTQLTMNGEALPYTTDLGRDWEPWMAFRELYANALDEGGDVARSETAQESCGDETVISVDLAAFEAIFFSMEEHFIGREDAPLWKSREIEVYPGRSLFVFYKGVAIMKLKEPAAFRYNLLGYVDLTEDRTAKYDWQVRNKIASALAVSDMERIVHAAVDQRNTFEASLDYSSATPSDAFIGGAVQMGANCNPTAMALVKAQLPQDADSFTVISTEHPGGENLRAAVTALRKAGGDLAKVKFVLADGMRFYGDHEVRGDAILINEAIYAKPDRMLLAVFNGYADVVDSAWPIKRLIEMTRESAA